MTNNKREIDLSHDKASSQTLTNPCTEPYFCGSWYIASNAVDRNMSSCTRTGVIGGSSPDTSVWWRVDLGDIYSIHSIRILFKDFGSAYVMRQRGRFAGFSIYLSNSTNREDWVLCYKDGPELPPLDFNTTCIKYGRYVVYYNERLDDVTYPDGYKTQSITMLCEVIVYGCAKNGVYGVNCDLPCPANCQELRCHIVNGSCLGCRPGWTGDKCDKPCPFGWYGIGCENKCLGYCKNNVTCNNESGNCVGGCASGWMGVICNIECVNGTFGPGCIHNCSGNCLNDSHCNKTTGSCDLGCRPGYIGPFCNKTCPVGTYGNFCRKTCSDNCFNGTVCNYVDGICSNGCNNGYTGYRCNTRKTYKYKQ
ncbi:multiple epidermal growth factor-like domains protein 10 [Saccostrea echinata]|uniref:multiple epidermal growth factor-like domains protein 10 n=1 Tax=Saccostrea echinata TaxID=191078 RepID=UPI002A7F8C02|nr:multiple epidermal growth factor-like domains protein 10 [Saccostrea echinata]